MDVRKIVGVVSLIIYTLCIYGANWAIKKFGFVPVGFGLTAPAGVFFAGAVFVARDLVQLTLGKKVVLAAIAAGALLSWHISAALAFASGTAFFVSELADYAVYTPLADRGRVVLAVLLSDTVGLVLDSLLFLWLAFHSTAHWLGTAVGKEWLTLLVIPAVWALRKRLRPMAVAA